MRLLFVTFYILFSLSLLINCAFNCRIHFDRVLAYLLVSLLFILYLICGADCWFSHSRYLCSIVFLTSSVIAHYGATSLK